MLFPVQLPSGQSQWALDAVQGHPSKYSHRNRRKRVIAGEGVVDGCARRGKIL
jgi:hypothetical protein